MVKTSQLRPLKPKQFYISASPEVLREIAADGPRAPGLVNHRRVSAIFEPLNDSPLVLVAWSVGGGLSVSNRDTIKIVNVETGTVEPAWETIQYGTWPVAP